MHIANSENVIKNMKAIRFPLHSIQCLNNIQEDESGSITHLPFILFVVMCYLAKIKN